MSFFLAYFESKNRLATDFKGFSDVGNFCVPESMRAGNINILLGEKKYNGQLVSDHSFQSANDLFRKKEGGELREELFRFIAGRLLNTCVVANIVGYILRNGARELQIAKLHSATFSEFKEQFGRRLFENGVGLSLKN